MDGYPEDLSRYPLTLTEATGGSDWAPWFDRIAGTLLEYRRLKMNDPVRNEGQPQYQTATPGIPGRIDTSTVLMLGAALLVVWFVVKK